MQGNVQPTSPIVPQSALRAHCPPRIEAQIAAPFFDPFPRLKVVLDMHHPLFPARERGCAEAAARAAGAVGLQRLPLGHDCREARQLRVDTVHGADVLLEVRFAHECSRR